MNKSRSMLCRMAEAGSRPSSFGIARHTRAALCTHSCKWHGRASPHPGGRIACPIFGSDAPYLIKPLSRRPPCWIRFLHVDGRGERLVTQTEALKLAIGGLLAMAAALGVGR